MGGMTMDEKNDTVRNGGGAYGLDTHNQCICREVSQTVRLPLGSDSYAKVIVWLER